VIPNLDRHLQRVYLGKAHEVPPNALHWLQEEHYVVFENLHYRLTDTGEIRRKQLRESQGQASLSATLGEMIAKRQKTAAR
jgi:hypothetical protein